MARPGGSAGFTLIELLIASLVGLGVLASAIALLVNSQGSYRKLSLSRQIQENGRVALALVGAELRMAGFHGLNAMPYTLDTESVRLLKLGCGGEGWAIDVSRPLQVIRGGNPFAGNCIPEQNVIPDTDILVVRGADLEPLDPTGIRSGSLYLFASLGSGMIFLAREDGEINEEVLSRIREEPVALYRYSTRIYYIRPCSEMSSGRRDKCDGADDGIPTLVRTTVGGTRIRTEPLVEFVEDLQLELGIDTSPVPDGEVDRFVRPDDVTDWSRVVTCRIDLLVRAAGEMVSDGTGERAELEFNPGGEVTASGGHHLRKSFTETVMLRNPVFMQGQM